LVRAPGARLAEGTVTHISRVPVDVALARNQHQTYVDALERSGWRPVAVPVDDGLPDSVFIEDAVVVHDGLAVLTRPGAPQRRPETGGVAGVLPALDLMVTRIEAPGTLDGGDVLRVGTTVYVGTGHAIAALGWTPVPVDITEFEKLEGCVTCLSVLIPAAAGH
jgi:dimethylargininase